MMRDEEFLARLDDIRFDLAVVDGFALGLCSFIVPHRLRVPFVDFFASPKGWRGRVPVLPSASAHLTTGFSDRMTFYQRLVNLAVYIRLEMTDYNNIVSNE